MAEVVAVLGTAAAAAQFADIGSSLILKTSRLISRFKAAPELLELAKDEVQELLEFADLVETRTSAEITVQCIPNRPEPSNRLRRVRAQRLESAWRRCTEQAKLLENIINALVDRTEDSRIQRIWKRVCSVTKEKEIRNILQRIESQKSSLTLWYSQECSDEIKALSTLPNDVIPQMLLMNREIGQMRSEISQLAHTHTLVGMDIQEREAPTASNQQQRRSHRQKLASKKPLEPLEPQSSNEIQNPSSSPAMSQARRCMARSKVSSVNFLGFVFVFRQQNRSFCPLHSDPISHGGHTSSVELYTTSRTARLGIICHWYPRATSINITLKAQCRVKELPLERFFWNIFHSQRRLNRRSSKLQGQEELLPVVRKAIQKAYSLGELHPNQVNRDGETLLHWLLVMQQIYFDQESLFQKLINELLSIGFKLEAEDDNFRSVQEMLLEALAYYCRMKKLNLRDSILAQPYSALPWTLHSIPTRWGAIEIAASVLGWPEASSAFQFSRMLDIIERRSVSDLKDYLLQKPSEDNLLAKHATPLHFATTFGWVEGVEMLLAQGMNQFHADASGRLPLRIALDIKCPPVFESLISHDVVDCFRDPCDQYNGNSIPWLIRTALRSDSEEIQDITAKILARDRHMLPAIRPYHELADTHSIAVLEKLYAIGFQDVEEYDSQGRTPLICACHEENWKMISFLLQKGAKITKYHRDYKLLPGHFLSGQALWRCSDSKEWPCCEVAENAQKLLRAAFDASPTVDALGHCCSQIGYYPFHAPYQHMGRSSWFHVRNFGRIMAHLQPSESELRTYWRDFVRLEIFNRLELTHTCFQDLYLEVRTFTEDERIEIEEEEEEEEEELYEQLEELLAEYDKLLLSSTESVHDFNHKFLDMLDHYLPPLQDECSGTGWGSASDLLGANCKYSAGWNSSGERIMFKYRERGEESNMLSLLFD